MGPTAHIEVLRIASLDDVHRPIHWKIRMGNLLTLKSAWLALAICGLVACGGGSSSSSSTADSPINEPVPDPDDGDGAGTGTGAGAFSIMYTHTREIASWEWAVDWFVESQDALTGPFDSGGTGVVDLGNPATTTVHLSRREGPFVVTYMDVPVDPITYYTGAAEISPQFTNVTVNVDNATVGDELLLFYPFVNWWSIDQNPYSLTQSVSGVDIVDDTGRASVFVSYRQSSVEEPNSRYGFVTDLDPSMLSNVEFDVVALHQRTQTIEWQSSGTLTGFGAPSLWAKHNGVYLLVGDSTDGVNTSGLIGWPDQFPADEWYLLSGLTARPDMVKRVNPGTATIPLEPMSGFIEDNSVFYDPVAGTLSVNAPGMTSIDFGHVLFGSTTSPWELYFPASAITITGDLVVIHLPMLVEQTPLPDFQSVSIDFYRLDDGGTPEAMYRHLWNRRGEPIPSYAMHSAFETL